MTTGWLPVLMPSMLPAGRALSEHEWDDLPEDEPGELVEGRLEAEELPDPIHELAVSWLIAVFRAWLAGKGFVFGSELKLIMSPRHGRKADVVVFLPSSAPPLRRGAVRHPPDILLEVVTPTPRDERRDRVEKMAEYAAFGVPLYGLIDPALGSVEFFERDPSGRYVRAAAATQGRLEVPGCQGLQLDLDALWAELGRLPDVVE